jgi:hypothetical protein
MLDQKKEVMNEKPLAIEGFWISNVKEREAISVGPIERTE